MGFRLFKKRDRRSKRQAEAEKRKRVEQRGALVSGLLLAFLLWISALVLIYSGGARAHSNLAVGQRSPVTVIAETDFSCADIANTELNRVQAANAVPPVFSIDYSFYNTATRSVDKLFDRIIQLRRLAESRERRINVDDEINNVLDLLGVPLSPKQARQLAPKGNEEKVRDAVKKALKKTWATGIISAEEKKTEYEGLASIGRIMILRGENEPEGPVELNQIPLPDTALENTVDEIREQAAGIRLSDSILEDLLRNWMVPNLVYVPQITAENKAQAEAQAKPATMDLRAGTTIVESGERITPQILEQLNAHEVRRSQLESPYDRITKKIGSAGLLMAVLIACIGLVQILTPDVTGQESKILLLVVLSLLAILPAKGLLYLSSSLNVIPPTAVEFAVPLAMAPLLASILLGSAVAIPIGIWISFAVSVLFNNNFTILTLGFVTTAVASLSMHKVRSRSRIYRAGLFVGLAGMLYAISLGAVTQQSMQVVTTQSLVALGSGIVSAFLTILFIPLFEWLFHITTDITLLELSDMSNPLLQRLAMEAPGTYHHSIVVANLGEAAASRIGANSLLVRVGAYFHDIGKLAKPEFFTENMNLRDNPHDDLSPNMSTIVITSHVKEGMSLGRRHQLPKCILDAIEQHHGTGIVSFFYHRAKQQAGQTNGSKNKGTSISEEDFRYDGPKPQSREMGILSIADSVEAAARSLEKPSPTRIEALVDEVTGKKIQDGQLDDCDLTLAELKEIKSSLVFTLANMLHVRIAYPQDEDKSPEQTENGSTESTGTQASAPMAVEKNGNAPGKVG